MQNFGLRKRTEFRECNAEAAAKFSLPKKHLPADMDRGPRPRREAAPRNAVGVEGDTHGLVQSWPCEMIRVSEEIIDEDELLPRSLLPDSAVVNPVAPNTPHTILRALAERGYDAVLLD